MTDSITGQEPDFTPNPDRAIWIDGQLNEALLERLFPEILDLTAHNREPITVFIDSPGGSSAAAEIILSLLRRTTEDDPRVSRIITVAAPRAKSAAATLLSGGDFAIAPPGGTLLYHGARWQLDGQALTGEWAKTARTLPTFHEEAAAKLAHASMRRFLFIVSACRPLFAQHRADKVDPTLTDLACFQAILRGKLSPAAQKGLDLAIPLWDTYNRLLHYFQKRLRRGRTVTKAHLVRLRVYASVDFEHDSNKGSMEWDGGFGRIAEHFYFLNAYFDFDRLCEWVAGGKVQVAADVEADELLHFHGFFRALCRALQEGENYITPMDAVWLGLIDTIR